jgi:hypothetical protein
VVHRTALRPVSLAVGVDDFAFDPADGLLYGVSATSRGDSAVVTLDPASGKVAVVPGLRFPEGGAYGSVVLAPGAIYATANRERQRSVTYRLPRDGSGQATEVATGPPLVSGDAAGCLWEAPPPSTGQSPEPPPRAEAPPVTQSPEPTPPEPSSPSPSQLPPVEQPVALPPAPVPVPPSSPVVTPPPVTSAPPPPPSPSPPPPTTSRARPVKEAEPVVQDTGRRTEEKRRWGLTALILVLGGGAAVAHGRRHR